jgi:hypothetical protein
MVRRHLVTALTVALVVTLATVATTSSAHGQPGTSAASKPSIVQTKQILPLISVALRAVATRVLLHWLPRYIVKRQVTRWVESRAAWVPPRLDSRFFGANRPSTIRGVGMVFPPPGYSGMKAWSKPSTTAEHWIPVSRYVTLGLSCYTFGEGLVGWDGYTSLWYRTWTGWYVWDGWLYTGTTAALPGVLPC